MIIDAQVHLWEADRPDRLWPPYRHLGSHHPEADPPVGPIEILAAMDEIGVDRVVIVPPSWIGEGNESAIEWSQTYPDRFTIMGRFDFWHPDAERRLLHWLEQPGMLGIRASWSSQFGEEWLDPDTFPWFWESVERQGIPMMISPVGGASSIRPIAERHPGLTLILDHLGLHPHRALHPDDEGGEDSGPFAGLDEVIELAAFPRVLVKFSNLPNLSDEAFPHPKMAPHLRRAFDAFGRERIMWGSDYTVLTAAGHTYRECLDQIRTLDFLTEEDREWILWRTASTALNWPA